MGLCEVGSAFVQPAGGQTSPASPARPAHADPCCRGAETRRPRRTRARSTQGQRRTRAGGAAGTPGIWLEVSGPREPLGQRYGARGRGSEGSLAGEGVWLD